MPVVWAQADPAKEVADIALKRAQAVARGDIDAFLADVADNVVLTGARSGFRIEGKEAFRTFLTNQWQNYPTRQGLARQVTSRVLQEGNVVVVNYGYNDQTFIDKSGTMSARRIGPVRRGSRPAVAGCSSISMSQACRAPRNQGLSPYHSTSAVRGTAGHHGRAVLISRQRDPPLTPHGHTTVPCSASSPRAEFSPACRPAERRRRSSPRARPPGGA